MVDAILRLPSVDTNTCSIDVSNPNFDDDQFLVDPPPLPSCFKDEVRSSITLMKGTKLNYLLVFAPLAVVGSKSGWLGEFQCFCCAGLALIPCAERYV